MGQSFKKNMPPHGTLRSISAEEIPLLAGLQPDGWPDIRRFFQSFVTLPYCAPIVLEASDGQLIGIANSSRFGDVGWLGPIIVGPAWQGRGIGSAFTRAVMDDLLEQGCTRLALIASSQGESIYRKLGFVEAGSYTVFSAPARLPLGEAPDESEEARSAFLSAFEPADAVRAASEPSATLHIEPLEPSDLEAVLALDLTANGFDRSVVYTSYPFAGWAAKDIRSGALRGVYFPGIGEGNVIAADEEAGFRLLQQRLRIAAGRAKGHLVLPGGNTAAAERLSAAGWLVARSMQRMTWGPPLDWQPQLIYQRMAGYWG